MKYEEAVKLWADKQIEHIKAHSMMPETFGIDSVVFELDEGYACCGGNDPDCYCSFAESPSLQARITYHGPIKGAKQMYSVSVDFDSVLQELFEISK